jgi:Zn-dependent protease
VSVHVKLAIFMAVVLVPSVVLHEYAHAWTASRLGDWSSRRFGRMTLDPRPHIDRFGTLFLPGILLVMVASGVLLPVFAYAKPQPVSVDAFRTPRRGATMYALSGPAANLLLAVIFGIALRAAGGAPAGTLTLFLFAGLIVNVVLCVFNLIPIPGLDGARLVAPLLSYRARQLYERMDEYLPLFMLLVFFILAGLTLGFVRVIGNALCRLIVGNDCL